MTLLDIDPPLAALDRLVTIAQGDTSPARRVANFLLAWWNASDCGGFDFTDLWMLDRAIIDDLLSVIQLIVLRHTYPDAYVCRRHSNAWRRTGGPSSRACRSRILPERRRHGRPALPASRGPVREMASHG